MNVFAIVLSLGLLAPGATVARQDESNAFVREAYGFKIERPDPSWTFVPIESGGPQKLTLTISPPNARPASFIVYVAETEEPGTTAEAVRDKILAGLEKASAREIESGTGLVDERSAPFLRCKVPGLDGKVYDVSIHYLAANGLMYALQTTVREGEEPPAEEFHHLLDSFEIVEIRRTDEETSRARLLGLADRCGSEIEWAEDWEEASARASEEKKLVLVVFESYAGLQIPATGRSGLLMDPDLLALIQARFVAFEMAAGDAAPFRADDSFGLSASSWGNSLLFATAEGKVLAETGLRDAAYVDAFAREVLGRAAESDPALVPDLDSSGDRLDRAEALLAQGELDRAEELLERATSVRGHRLRAALMRRRHDGPGALQELASARAQASEEELVELDADEALVRMRMGQTLAAESAWRELAEEHPGSGRAPEAMFWLGALETLRNGATAPASWWERLVDEHEQNRWAWKAAANLVETGAFVNGGERLEWPSSEMLAAVKPLSSAALETSEARRAEKDAVAFLLEHQQDDGSWIHPEAFALGSSGYTDATAAICGLALLQHARDKEVAKALDKALDYALEAHRTGRLTSGEGLLGVYSIWRQTFAALFFARCIQAKVGDEEDLLEATAEIVDSIEERQHESGGWPYVFYPGDPEGKALNPSASFLTAGVLFALLEAREAGVEVSPETLTSARAFLVRLRQEDGSFRYMQALPGKEKGGSFPEACGRSPLCALAVHRSGEPDLEGLRKAFEQYVRHRPGLVKVRGKELCHTGPQGQGSHYLLFDYAFAALALRELPLLEHSKLREILLTDILACRLEDGSFQDMPGLGRAYGTGMALLGLRALEPELAW